MLGYGKANGIHVYLLTIMSKYMLYVAESRGPKESIPSHYIGFVTLIRVLSGEL